MVMMPTQSIVPTTWKVGPDVSLLFNELKSARTVKTQLRLFFVGEDHWYAFDQQRRHRVVRELKAMGKTAQPVYTIVERGLDADTEGLANVLQEDTAMHAGHDMRNENVRDSVVDVLKTSKTLPDLVFLFGANHERGIVQKIVDGVNDCILDKSLGGAPITELLWRSWRPIDTWVKAEPQNVAWEKLVKPTPSTLLGYVERDEKAVDHNMELAEKCVVKFQFQVELRPRDLIMTDHYWALYAAKESLALNTIRNMRGDTYVGPTKLDIQAVNPSLIIKAVRH